MSEVPTGAGEILLPHGRRSKTSMLLHRARQYERWAGLTHSVLTGEPIPEERLELAAVSRFPDVGGGPGAYAVELCRRRPDARAAILDRPAGWPTPAWSPVRPST